MADFLVPIVEKRCHHAEAPPRVVHHHLMHGVRPRPIRLRTIEKNRLPALEFRSVIVFLAAQPQRDRAPTDFLEAAPEFEPIGPLETSRTSRPLPM